MDFSARLQRIVDQIPKCFACVLMGFDGIAIARADKHTPPGDPQMLLAQVAQFASQIRPMLAESGVGGLTEFVIEAQQSTCLVRPLTESYFLTVLMPPGPAVAAARMLMRMATPGLARQVA